MRVVKDDTKGNGERLFFVCSNRNKPCSFWQWAAVAESPTSICCHGQASCIRKVKKEGLNQCRLFYCCPNERENACELFEWKPVENSPPVYKIGCMFSSPPGLYQYMVADTGETFASRKPDTKEAYEVFLHQKSVLICIFRKWFNKYLLHLYRVVILFILAFVSYIIIICDRLTAINRILIEITCLLFLCDAYEELNPNTIDCIMLYLNIVYKVAQKLRGKLWEGWLNSLKV